MEFGEFAKVLEKLETTASRLTMTEILANLFKQVSETEIGKVAYLTQGKLGPAYKTPDFGMADKQVIKAIKRLSDEDIESIYKRTGDLGLTVEKVKQEHKGKDEGLTIIVVYKRLEEIAKAEGQGSQEEKIKRLEELLQEVDPRSAKYIVRMVLGKLRAGFSDMTVLDSLSWMKTGGKSLRKEIERIYNVRADLGEVTEMIKKHSEEEIKKLRVEPMIGAPVLMARAERSTGPADVWKRLGNSGEVIAEHKLDGLRLEAHVDKDGDVRLFSRGLENVTAMYPDVVAGLKEQVKCECILDGEMIAVDKTGKYMPFQETVQRKRKYNIEEMLSEVPLKYYVFDLLMKDGKGWLEKPNSQRRQELEKTVKQGEVIRLMPREEMKSEKDVEKFFEDALSLGTEGIMVKKAESGYQAGNRNFNWIKLKSELDTVDCVVMGYSEGEGKRADFGIGEFLVGVIDKNTEKFLTITKVGSGATDEGFVELRKLLQKYETEEKPREYEVNKQYECDHWVSPAVVVEIKANELTVSPTHTAGYALRFPRLVAIREKKPNEATSGEEIKKLFKLQKK